MPNFSIEAVETFLKSKRITIEIPLSLNCISMREIVNLIVEAKTKLDAIDIKQPKWKLAALKNDLAQDLCRTLNWLGFRDEQGMIVGSDEPPLIKFQFGWDSKMQLTVAKDLLGRHGYILQQNQSCINDVDVNSNLSEQKLWTALASQYADEEALMLYKKDKRKISQRKIAPLVAKRFEKEGIYGESGVVLDSATVRRRGLKGWSFKLPKKNGASGA